MSTSADPAPTGLLVDDDPLYLRTLQRSLHKRGVHAVVATTGEEALRLSREHPLEFALLDLRLGTESGLELIGPLRQLQPQIRIVLMTGYASVATAVEAIKRGADNYLLKPTTVDLILRTLAGGGDGSLEPQSTMTPLSRLEWEHIHQALAQTQGNVSAAARLLGMHRRSLQRKLSKRPGPERRPPGSED